MAQRSALTSRRQFAAAASCIGVSAGFPALALADDVYTLRLSVTTPANSVYALAAVRFAEACNHRSNGRLKIEVYPSGQIASEKESIDGLITGTLDLAAQSSAFIVPIVPRFQVLDLPFLVGTVQEAYRVMDSSVGDELFAELEPKGIVGLGWGSGGFKQLETTTKPVVTLDDMKGLRFRVQTGAISVATYQALGAVPLVIDVSESYVALTQHTIDGIDINLDAANSGKFWTVIKHVALSNHFAATLPLLGSKKKLDALPADLRRIVREEGKGVIPYWRSLSERQVNAAIQVFKDNGATFTQIQYPAFRKAVDPVYAQFSSRVGADLIDRIGRVASGRR